MIPLGYLPTRCTGCSARHSARHHRAARNFHVDSEPAGSIDGLVGGENSDRQCQAQTHGGARGATLPIQNADTIHES